jgi:hypothetical protein
LTFDFLELISQRPWKRATFTTYALSLSFFEAVVLDALIRAQAQQAVIFSDVLGVQMGLGELGARRVGKDYDIEPLNVQHGIFHPKIGVFLSDDDCHVVVGSGNLTFAGWGQNCEVIEHLHPTFAADAIADTADFFESLALTDSAEHDAEDLMIQISEEIRGSIGASERPGRIRMIHSLERSIEDQIIGFVGDLGGATSLAVVSPFWDSGMAIDRLCHKLSLDEYFAHSHSSTVMGRAGSNWPFESEVRVHPVQLEQLSGDNRALHAKMYEIACKRGRLIISGSANATTAAFAHDRNVEACVARIQTGTTIGWRLAAAQAPAPTSVSDDVDKGDQTIGVVRATLKGNRVVGRVLTPHMQGDITVFHSMAAHLDKLAIVPLTASRQFEFEASKLELAAWGEDRIILRVIDNDGNIAEGFLCVAAFQEIKGRAGSIASRLFALLSGTETPDDVAAIMVWFQKNPSTLEGMRFAQRGSSQQNEPRTSAGTTLINIGGLAPSPVVETDGNSANDEDTSSQTWIRFMESVHAAFRLRRGSRRDNGTNPDNSGRTRGPQQSPKIPEAFECKAPVLCATS